MNWWLALGIFGQVMFAARFGTQWIMSEIKKQSYIPKAFWFFSLAGGSILFVYALHLGDPVFIAGQGGGLIIYVRNLMLIRGKK